MKSSVLSLSLGGALAFCFLASGAHAQWDPNFGTLLSQADDNLSASQAMAFAFPLPGGGTTNAINVSTNGWISLDGSHTSSDYTESVAEFLTEGPRIAALWDDLTGSASGGVQGQGTFINLLPNKTVVTWDMRELGTSDLVTVQLQLFPTGAFTIQYVRGADSDALVGVSPGLGAVDPGASDLSAGVPNGGSTIYELFNATVGLCDLNGKTLAFTPVAGMGYNGIAIPGTGGPRYATGTARGTGCGAQAASSGSGGSIHEYFSGSPDVFDLPAGSSLAYSFIAGTGYGVAVGPAGLYDPNIGAPVVWSTGTGDDSLSTQTLPFNFPLAGGGTTNSIDVCSNGFVWLVSGSSTSSDYSPSSSDFQSATNPARIAALWTDLNTNPSSSTPGGGTVAFTATAGRAMVTWDQVPNYGNTGTVSTVQLQMFPNGSFFVVYQSVNLGTGGIVGDEALIGYTIGNNTAKPAEVDFSTALPAAMLFTEVPATTATSGVSHDCDLLQLGSTPTARASALPIGTLAAVLHLGTNQTMLPLDAIGMPGCTAYTTMIAATAYMTLGTGQTASLPLGTIPNAPALKGVPIVTQAIGFKPGINALSLVASNAWDSIIGD